MAKSYKPLNETSGRNRPCLRCFNCKTQTFRDLNKLVEFCKIKEFHLRLQWKRRIIKDEIVKLYWCTKSGAGPRIFRESDSPFITRCKQFNEGDVDGNT